ncbi:MAG TPA: Trk system potassium transporter TrkA [Bacteroidales bacterium]|nr:Trk system potassium transporter TrkA [Bacteroidales bacterium]
MKIVIAGAGEVGSHLAKMLSNENHDIVLIDTNEDHLKDVGANLDVLTFAGSATSINILQDTGIKKADLFIAVTQSEEINITSSIIGKRLGAQKTIARIDNQEYLLPANREHFTSLGIDYMIYPERIAAREIVGLLQQTGTTEVVDFSGGRLSLFVIKLDQSAPIINKTLNETNSELSEMEFRAVAITRNSETLIPRGDDVFLPNDQVYVITNQAGIDDLMKYSGKEKFDVDNIMILGGSRIGKMTAKVLGGHHNVKLIEADRSKSYQLSNYLNNTLVINGDGRNIDMLMDEGLPKMDAFIAVTGNSETNMLSCLLANKMGVKRTIAEIENMDYIPLAENMGIDTVINKKLITASRIFRFTMTEEVSTIKCLTGTDAEVMEFVVKPESKAVQAKIKDIDFPDDSIIGGIIRGKNSFIAKGETEIKPFDRVVVFALPSAIFKVGKYFS